MLGLAALTIVAAGLPGCRPPDTAWDFVRRSGTQLTVNGHPWAFAGMNVYNLNSRGWCWFEMAGTDGLRDAVAASGATVVRGGFFESMVVPAGSGASGQIDWATFDDALARAHAAGVRVVVTLADQWGACEAGDEKPTSWYESDYSTVRPGGYPVDTDVLPLTYREYVAAIVARYKDDPTILAWQPLNEPQACGPTGTTALLNFTSDVTSLIKQIDPNHLVSLGTIGGGQCGTANEDYQALHALPAVDWCEVHDYGPSGTTLPGDQWNGVAVRFAQCAALGKPLVLGETGIRLDQTPTGSPTERATAFDEKFDTYRAAGAVGALVWTWADTAHLPDIYGIGPGDPTLAVIADHARTWAAGG